MKGTRKYISVFLLVTISILFLNFSILITSGNSITKNTYKDMEIKSSDASDLIWNTTFGGKYGYVVSDIAVDKDGNTIVTGETTDSGDVSGDLFIAKFNSTGGLLWNVSYGGPNHDEGNAVEVDDSGNIYICGITYSYGGGLDDLLLLKYSADGQLLLNTTHGSDKSDRGNDLVLDNQGNIYCIGESWDDISQTFYVTTLKYNSNFDNVWTSVWNSDSNDFGEGITLGGNNDVICTGYTYGEGASGRDFYILKYDSSGNMVWNTTWGSTGYDTAHNVITDNNQNIYCIGRTESSDLSQGAEDLVLVKFDENGNELWNTTWGGTGNDWGWDIALGSDNNIYCVGSSNTITESNYHDIIIFGYSPDGAIVWNASWSYFGPDETVYDYGKGIVSDANGHIYVTGITMVDDDGWNDVAILAYDITGGNSNNDNPPGNTTPDNNVPGFPYQSLYFSLIFGILIVFLRTKKNFSA